MTSKKDEKQPRPFITKWANKFINMTIISTMVVIICWLFGFYLELTALLTLAIPWSIILALAEDE